MAEDAYEVLIETTRGILKSQTSFGVTNGATNPPDAASTAKTMRLNQISKRHANKPLLTMDGYRISGLRLVFVEKIGHFFDRLIVARVCT